MWRTLVNSTFATILQHCFWIQTNRDQAERGFYATFDSEEKAYSRHEDVDELTTKLCSFVHEGGDTIIAWAFGPIISKPGEYVTITAFPSARQEPRITVEILAIAG